VSDIFPAFSLVFIFPFSGRLQAITAAVSSLASAHLQRMFSPHLYYKSNT
jgi:hypothetical protein